MPISCFNPSAYFRIFKMKGELVINNAYMEQDEGTLERENKGKQNMLITKGEELSKWTHLPSDILQMIMKRLKLIDYLGIRGVCSPWTATITEAIANKLCHPLPELPLVFLKKKNSVLPSRFFSISTEQACSLKSKSTLLKRNHTCHGVVEGWMIFSDNGGIFFWNPVTNDEVRFSHIPNRSDLHLGKMVASSSPKCEDCFVVALFIDYAHIVYCRVNSDKSWTMIDANKEDRGIFLDVEIFYGKLYVRTNSSVLVYDLHDSSDHPSKPKVLGAIPPIRPLPKSSRHDNQIHVTGNVISYLTRGYASEELLLIYLFINYVYKDDNVGYMNVIKQFVSQPHITKCEVFKLDTSDNKWVKLDHLGDRVVFLGSCKSLVMSRATLNSTEELILENTIYFALNNTCPASRIRLGRLCLTDNNIKYFSMEQFGHKMDAYPFWFLPSAW